MNKLIGLLIAATVALTGCASAQTAQKANMHIYIVHGYGASPSDHWFPWLKKEMEKMGATVSIVNLPSPNDPQPKEWQQALKAQVSPLDRNTYFVTHSLGGITLLTFLEGTPEAAEIGGYILVSGFNDSLPILPQLNSFKKPNIAYDKLSRMTKNRVVISAIDDSIVPHALSKALADSLDAKFIPVERGGHFLGSDGFTEFPLVLEELERVITSGQ
ncbi:MAG TPA: alpha/beta hydrolase [Alphaproteobacteria bacterium]|nr:alpha/beta hydrolase [Alphaproteobacteria bacterium]